MKRILLLLLFNLSIATAFSQVNGYFKSTHIINSDSTHGELNGTEYINDDGKFRYKENGVWKYRASTADLASAGISNTAGQNELMKAQTANGDAIGAGIWSTTPANLTFGIGTTGTSRVLLADGSTSNISISLKSKGTGASILWDGNENNFLSVASAGVTGRSNVGFYFEGTSSNTNTVLTAFRLAHNTSGTPAAGIGTALRFETETSASNLEFGSAIESVSTDVTSSSEDFDLVFKNMSGGATAAERFRFSSFGGFGIGGANYGTSGQVLTSNGSSAAPTWETPAASVVVESGEYTPTLTNVTNVASSSINVVWYTRIGNEVRVRGFITVQATAADASTEVQISLPIAATFPDGNSCSGMAVNHPYPSVSLTETLAASINSDYITQRARFLFISDSTNTREFSFMFSYQIN